MTPKLRMQLNTELGILPLVIWTLWFADDNDDNDDDDDDGGNGDEERLRWINGWMMIMINFLWDGTEKKKMGW